MMFDQLAMDLVLKGFNKELQYERFSPCTIGSISKYGLQTQTPPHKALVNAKPFPLSSHN